MSMLGNMIVGERVRTTRVTLEQRIEGLETLKKNLTGLHPDMVRLTKGMKPEERIQFLGEKEEERKRHLTDVVQNLNKATMALRKMGVTRRPTT